MILFGRWLKINLELQSYQSFRESLVMIWNLVVNLSS